MSARRPVVIVGAGLSGAVIARQLAEAGQRVEIFETRNHVAGNCHTRRDPETGVLLHVYGPHIFHTDNQTVWDYVQRFATFEKYQHRVQSTIAGQVYSLPINLVTINQFYGLSLNSAQAKAFLAEKADATITDPQNFEEQALSSIGPDLYEAFLRPYTEKQWGCSPRDLPAAILKRLPVRFTNDNAYFAHRFQGIPRDGYTPMVAAILDHPGITLWLNTRFDRAMAAKETHIFCSGAIDGWFAHSLGHLGYRTLDFEHFTTDGDFQGCPVMNYGDAEVPYTRITEHKHFAPWESHARSICTREFSRACDPGDTPYYPIRLLREKAMLADYVALAEQERNVTFVGRLGTYRYLDMDICIGEALETANIYLHSLKDDTAMPTFVKPPLPSLA